MSDIETEPIPPSDSSDPIIIEESYFPESIIEDSGPSRLSIFFKELLETLIWVAILFLIVNFFSLRVLVKGRSMEPSLQDGNFLLVNRLAYNDDLPARGEVIVFTNPSDTDIDFIKRVIGLPGDTIEVNNGTLYLNNQIIDESYILSQSLRNTSPVVVPEGHVFVLGDNRNVSSDSRTWGPLDIDEILGKPILIYWPPNQWGDVPHSTETFEDN